jgi:hypothetical protein
MLLSRLYERLLPDTLITDADISVILVEQNSLSVTGVTNATSAVVTFDTNHGFEIGDRVYVTRVLGTESANGFATVSAKTDTTITLSGIDTSGDPVYKEGSGAVFLLVLNDDEDESVEMVYNTQYGAYVATIGSQTDIVPKRKYLVILSCVDLGFYVEHPETGGIKTR